MLGLLAMALLLPLVRAQVGRCDCDVARPETMESRECGLCRAAEEQPPDVAYFAIRDANPTKPNRWLALPRYHGHNPQELSGMTAAQRTAYWTFAIAKAHELWGEKWGLAVNDVESAPSATCTSTSASWARAPRTTSSWSWTARPISRFRGKAMGSGCTRWPASCMSISAILRRNCC